MSSNRYEYPQVSSYGQVTNDSNALELVSSPGTTLILYIERITISVFEAAVGGGGILEIKELDSGDVIYTINVDGIKDLTLDWGQEGMQLAVSNGVQVVVSGAQTKQASVSLAFKGHKSFRALE
jgi:hypothetical protein